MSLSTPARLFRPFSLLTATAILATPLVVAAPAAAASETPHLLITEIAPDNVGYDDFEFIEVHNLGTEAVDLDADSVGLSYIYADSDDRSSDVPLTVEPGTVIDAGETLVLWLSYTTSTVDSFAKTVDDFRSHFAATQPQTDYDVVRVTGQSGMANGGGRGVRLSVADAEVSRAFVPVGGAGTDLSVHFQVAASGTSAAVLSTLAEPSPGVVVPEALIAEEPEPVVEIAPRDLIVTEFAPDNEGTDRWEYVEVYNTTDHDIDLTATNTTVVYDYVSNSKALAFPAGSVISAGEAAVLWLQYSPNTDGYTADDFRAFYNADADLTVIPITGQSGFANGGGRGIRLVSGETVITEAWYAAGEVGSGTSVNYRLPARLTDTMMAVLEATVAPTPGVIPADTLVPAPFAPQPDADLVTAPLQITEVAPDTANVGGSDAYEFVEVYNATSAPVDFSDYTLKYLYPLADLTNSSTTLWPATVRDAVIPAGGTIVFWIKNGANDALTAADFNAHFGSSLIADESLFEIRSGGMSNSSARGLEITTNTGFTVNRAYYNLGGIDDTTADQPIQYAVNHDDLTLQTKLGTSGATPGAIAPEQVDDGLMIVPADTTAPEIADQTAAEIAPGMDFEIAVRATDDIQVKTLSIAVRSNLDAQPIRHEIVSDGADGYVLPIAAADLTGKRWFEYIVVASDGTNESVVGPVRVALAGVDTSPVRLNVTDEQWVRGEVGLIAGGDTYPAEVELSIDGAPVAATPQLEAAPVFAFEASGVDTFFRNGVKVGDDVLHIFDDGIYSGWDTISTAVPLGYVTAGQSVTVSVWAGTKAAPEINLDENNDDFSIKGLRLILPDGRTLTPAGYDDPTAVLAMGDSAGKYDYYDATFTIPADAATAVSYAWDTTAVTDGEHLVSASDGGTEVAAQVRVDNTLPDVTTDLEADKLYQGTFTIDAQASDIGSGLVSLETTLDGRVIALPYETSSLTLAEGDHEVVITATDAAGNVTERVIAFRTPVEHPAVTLVSPADGASLEEGSVTLEARAVDPTGDLLDVTFAEGHALSVGDGVTAATGTVGTADTTDRSGARNLTADEAAQLGTFDGETLVEASDTAFPYHLFDATVPADAGDDARVRVHWEGSANADAKLLLYALGVDGAWDEVDRLVTADDVTTVSLDAVLPVADYAVEGTVRLLVQHSEGFAGENLSSRESAVEPRNADDTPRSQYDFTLAVESDTQYYNEEFHQHQTAIHDYLLDERSDLNLQYLFHTGDIVDDYDQLWQWDYADPEYRKLDAAGLPYGVLAGNHDVGHKEVDYTNYGTYFGADRYQANPWWGGDYKNNRGHYDLITAGGIDFLMLYMGWGPGDDEIAWMNEVLAQYPERIVVLNLHEYMLTTGGLGPIPQQIYDEVIATNPNVRMVFSGHYHDAYTRIDGFDDDGDGTDDRQVYQILFDYQGLPEGGLGYLRLLHFDNENQQIIARTYSPSLDDYDADDPSLDPEHQEFTMPYAALGIQPAQKVLRTDGVRVDILTSHEIGAVSDVESGATTSVTWDAAPGEYGWYASSVDPFGAAADSEVRTLTVLAASGPGGGDNPGDGGSGGGDNPGDGGSGDGNGSGGGDSDGRPTEHTVPVSVADLDPSLEGAIAPSGTLRVGDPITISVPGHDGEWVQVWLHSTPTLISGWTKVAGGTVTATVPASVPAGTHTLVVQNSSGVIGWATVTVEGAAGQAVISDGMMAQTGADGLPLGIAGALALVAILVGAGILVRRRIAS